MGQIELLDQNMMNMIAAGEVIERPASVVKELLENSIDAGATKITVTIEDGGRKLISVTDNGCGMDAADLDAAFEPHTTSKIKTSSDLLGISTLGFRGEALASIASIAQVKAVSRLKDSDSANCIEIDCGSKAGVSPCSGDYGTTIQVRDIFYKLPARRKFLRTANTEMGHISEQFTRIALANQKLEMVLTHNGRETYRLMSDAGPARRISELFPSPSGDISGDLLEIRCDEKGIKIYALLGKPDISRANNKFQYIFLNGRCIGDKFISHAIKEAYRGLLEPNRFPVVFLFIQMPYEDYDVNVHPTKSEVRFYNANFVHSQILSVLREKLLGSNLQTQAQIPPVTGRQNISLSASPIKDQKIADAMRDFFRKHQPSAQRQIEYKAEPKNYTTSQRYTPDERFLQLHDSYIVVQTEDGFELIDQHALHERIIYEDLRKRIGAGKLQSQRLLTPESFKVTEAQSQLLKKNAELLEKLGIELVPFAPMTMAIQAFPTILAKVEPLDFITDLLDFLQNCPGEIEAERLLDEVLDMASCKAAIKAGQKLTKSEIEQLLEDKASIDYANRCPHGRPTTIEFTMSELEKQFKRT